MTACLQHIALVFKNYLIVAFALLLLFQQTEAIAEIVHDEEIEFAQNTTLEETRTGVLRDNGQLAKSVYPSPVLKNSSAGAGKLECSSTTYYLFYRALRL